MPPPRVGCVRGILRGSKKPLQVVLDHVIIGLLAGSRWVPSPIFIAFFLLIFVHLLPISADLLFMSLCEKVV